MWSQIGMLLTLVVGSAVGLAAGRLSKRDEYVVGTRRAIRPSNARPPEFNEPQDGDQSADDTDS